jgi:hypothetical protein
MYLSIHHEFVQVCIIHEVHLNIGGSTRGKRKEKKRKRNVGVFHRRECEPGLLVLIMESTRGTIMK